VPAIFYAIDPLNTLSLSGQLTQFSTLTGLPVVVHSEGAQVGINHNFSQNFTANLAVGGQRSSWHFGEGGTLPDTSANSYSFAATVTYTGQQDVINLTAAHSPTPSAFGTETISTSVGLYYSHLLTPRSGGKLNLYYLQSDFPPGTTVAQRVAASTYVSAAPGAFYNLTDTVSVDLTYQYRRNQSVGGTDRNDNDIKFTITVQLLPRSL
jgi:opacity protein-like surface antigen